MAVIDKHSKDIADSPRAVKFMRTVRLYYSVMPQGITSEEGLVSSLRQFLKIVNR